MKLTAGKKLDALREGRYNRLNRKRRAEGGYLPTQEEIAEGEAWIRWINEPTPENRTLYVRAFNALMGRQQGRDLGTSRCVQCGVIRFGLPSTTVCGHCGGKGICVHGPSF